MAAEMLLFAVGIAEGMDEDEILNASMKGGVERFAEKFPV